MQIKFINGQKYSEHNINIQTEKNLLAGQVAVIAEKDALVLKGHDNIDDELIYRIVTDFGKSKESGISFVNDSLNIIA